ncbi:MAG: nuclear transport factor 2 family protein [Aliishimia sp.]
MELTQEDFTLLRTLEETLWRAETRYDPALMDRTFASDFFEVGRSGRRYERSEMLFDPDEGAVIDATLPLPGYSVSLVAPGVALATYMSEVRYGDELEVGRRSSLWTQIEGRWQLRYHQGTPC